MKRIILYLLLFVMTAKILPFSVSASDAGTTAGGLTILKTSVTGEPLEGAEFQILRELREGELADHTVKKQMVKFGTENRIMAVESFWDNREMKGESRNTIQTNQGGKAAICGLPFGTYYLVETSAPEGYNRITDPIRVTVHRYSHLTEEDNVRDDQNVIIDNTLHIINVRYSLPDTGNMEHLRLIAACTGILFSAAALILMNRKRW